MRINNKILTPDGVRDILPAECMSKTNLIKKIEAVFLSYGYEAIETPTFEYIEVFSHLQNIDRQMYKFFDREGNILTLRYDMTPPIARLAATVFSDSETVQRFCYFGNAFRYHENYMGKLQEFTQAGVELIGADSAEADAEVLAVAINSLLASGLLEFRIDIGHVKFFEGIMEESGVSLERSLALQEMILNKDYIGVEELIKSENMPENTKQILLELGKLVGQKELTERIRLLTNNEKALASLDRLDSIMEIIADYGLSKYISFDLGMISHLHYYTGVIFRGYTYGTGFSILDGGRYDNLIGKFGADRPSVGLAVKINDLLDIVMENQEPEETIAETLLVYTSPARQIALSTGDSLRRMGGCIETSLLGGDIEKNIDYALRKKISGLIYFMEDGTIRLYDLKQNTTMDTTVKELLEKGGYSS